MRLSRRGTAPGDRAACGRPGAPVVVLTGPPGTGKTTVAQILADQATPSVYLHGDDFWAFIRRGGVAPYLPEAREQNQVVVDVLARTACGYAAGGFHVVVDGVVGPWFLDPFKVAAAAARVALHYVVLRADEATTLARGTARGEGALTDPGPLRHMLREFTGLGALEAHVVDSSALGPHETADAVRAGLTAGTFLLPGHPRADVG